MHRPSSSPECKGSSARKQNPSLPATNSGSRSRTIAGHLQKFRSYSSYVCILTPVHYLSTAILVTTLIPFSERALRQRLLRCGVWLRFPPSDTAHRYTRVLTATLSFTFALTATLCFKRDFPPMRTGADLKGITNAEVPLYGSTRCHLMVQGTHKMSQFGASSFKDGRARWAVPVNPGSCQTDRRILADI